MTTPARWISAHLLHPGGVYGAESDRVLTDVIPPILAELQRQQIVSGWFFIRYGSGGPHVRFRLKGSPAELDAVARPLIELHCTPEASLDRDTASAAATNGIAWIEYEPEYERYGGPDGVQLAESHFTASSEMALRLIQRCGSDRNLRLGQGLLSMVVAFHTFFDSPGAIGAAVQRYVDMYLRHPAHGFQGPATMVDSFLASFQRQAPTLIAHVVDVWERLDTGQPISRDMDTFRATLRATRSSLTRLAEAGHLRFHDQAPVDHRTAIRNLVPSYVHMTSNRLGISIPEETFLAFLIRRAMEGLGLPASHPAQRAVS